MITLLRSYCCLAGLIIGQIALAQPIAMGASAQKTTIQAPKDVVASDGTYDKFVLVRWETSDQATAYKVFRSTNPKGATLQEVSNAWQKSTWICDYSAQPGVDYFYTVVASNGPKMSPTSNFDKGFIRVRPIANGEEEGLADNTAYGAPQQVFLLASDVNLSTPQQKAGETVGVGVQLQNIFDKQAPRTEVRFFFSEDAALSWSDKLLATKTLSSTPAQASFVLEESVRLPENLLPGKYFIIVVCSSDGEILNSKTDLTAIQIIE
ncbi:MAG: hypothetical protein HUU01_17240 [Saprospiraceae bacterium]|nr:hypothetical protein [Saprospiraceae bacterium]